jgi:hypothetical protein
MQTTDEKHVKKKSKSFKERIIIPHDSQYKAIFEVVILLLVGYSCVTSMLYTAFDPPTNQGIKIFEEIVEYLFMLDLVSNFFHSYVDQDSYEEVRDMKMIARKYVYKGWFLIDFVSVFPFKWFISSNKTTLTKLLRLLRLPRLIKLIDISRFKKLIKSFGGSSESRDEKIVAQQIILYVYKIIRIIIIAIIMSYFIGCIWFFMCS